MVTITQVRYASVKGRLLVAVLTILIAASCASFNPKLSDDAPFFGRSQTQRDGNVMVTAAVLSAAESEQAFGAKLYNKQIQPIWLRIENNDVDPMFFLPVGLDPEYFTPLEASYLNHSSSLKLNTRMDQHFYGTGTGLYIPPGESRSGFVFTNLDEGTKTFVVELLATDQELHTLAFFITVPGIRPDHTTVDFENLYPPGEIVPYDMAELRLALEQLPCCTKDKSSKNLGDPLNIAVIGTVDDVFFAFIQAGWDETETIYTASLGRTVKSFLFGGTYRYSPISALYVYGRGQDIAFQKARDTIHERNHLRLWMTNMRFDGAPVWIGQISRDVGVRFTSKTLTTHKIDPDVDESRGYLLQNLWYSQFLGRYAYVSGVGEATYDEPRVNLTGDPYFTDGLRAVMWVSSDPVSMEEVDDVQWENPAER
jgi:hypothetical protein